MKTLNIKGAGSLIVFPPKEGREGTRKGSKEEREGAGGLGAVVVYDIESRIDSQRETIY